MTIRTLDRISKRALGPITVAFALACSLACASTPMPRASTTYEPRGPGSEFATLEAAAIDALAWAHAAGERDATGDRLRGGAIARTERGFTYRPMVTASPSRPRYIEYALEARDVARYHAYPRTHRFGEDVRNERPSRADRRSVDQGDPFQRPIYVLTPRLYVKVYTGSEEQVRTVANLTEVAGDLYLARRDPTR